MDSEKTFDWSAVLSRIVALTFAGGAVGLVAGLLFADNAFWWMAVGLFVGAMLSAFLLLRNEASS